MASLSSKTAGRFSILARVGDVVLVSGFVLRYLNRRGHVSDELTERLGAPSSSGGSGISVTEMALVGAAGLRLIKGVKKRRAS